MESRKIQRVGAATFTVSLPREWVLRRNLRRGDELFIVEEGEGLRLLPSPMADHGERDIAEFAIDADLCEEPGMLERVIVGNYVLGRERILIESATRIRSEHQNEIRHAVRRLMGIGIMEETANRVRLQCSLNPSNYPLDALVKRLYNLGFTMLTESVEALLTGDAALAEDALKREDDADMMYWLILRLVLSAQLDEGLIEKLGMRTRLEIPQYRVISRDLEAVADHAYDVARHVKEILDADLKVPKPVLKSLESLSTAIGLVYSRALGGLLSRDLKQANEAIRLSKAIEGREEDLVRLVLKETNEVKTVVLLRTISSSMAQIAEYARSIAVIAYNRYLEKATNLCKPAAPKALAIPVRAEP